MSFTFTKDGIELTFLLKNKNWDILFKMLNTFRVMRGFGLESQQWLNLFADMKEDFLETLRYADKLPNINLYNWFIEFLGTYEEIKLTDIEKYKIKKVIESEVEE